MWERMRLSFVVIALALVAVVLTLDTKVALAANPTCVPTCIALPSSISLDQWNQSGTSWTSGAITSGYSEGQSVPFRVTVNGLTAGQQYYLRMCPDYTDGTNYGYFYLTPYNATYTPTVIAGTQLTLGSFLGVNLSSLDGVEETGGQGSCNSSGAREIFLIFTSSGNASAAIYFGGRLAAPGDTYNGVTVPVGDGASSFSGGSLSMRIDPTKNVGININKIASSTFITVSKELLSNGNYTPLNGWCFNISPNSNNDTLPKCAPAGTNSVTFSGLPSGTYTLSEVLQANYVFTEIRNTSVNCTRISNTSTATSTVTAAANPTTASCVFVNSSAPTSARLKFFKAVARTQNVKLKWRTETEFDVMGFNVWRGRNKNNINQKVNADLILVADPGSLNGHRYVLKDLTAKPGKRYFYQLEIVGVNGTLEMSDAVKVRKPPSH